MVRGYVSSISKNFPIDLILSLGFNLCKPCNSTFSFFEFHLEIAICFEATPTREHSPVSMIVAVRLTRSKISQRSTPRSKRNLFNMCRRECVKITNTKKLCFAMHHVTDAFMVGNAWPYSVLSSIGLKEFTKKRDTKSIVSTKSRNGNKNIIQHEVLKQQPKETQNQRNERERPIRLIRVWMHPSILL